jgi:hypothetical protein
MNQLPRLNSPPEKKGVTFLESHNSTSPILHDDDR